MIESRTQHVRILHLDDNEDDRIITRYHFSKLTDNLEILWAENADEALSIIQKDEQVDCVLCDYQMPEKDGLAFLDELRDHSHDIPVIMLTGNGNDEVASRAFELGADDYFSKISGISAYQRILNSVFTLVDSYANRKNSELLIEEYRQLFDENVSGAFEITPDGQFMRANESLKAILGFDEAAIPADFRFSSLFERPADWQAFKGKIDLDGQVKKQKVTLVDSQLQAKNVVLQAHRAQCTGSIIGTIRPANSKSVQAGNGLQHKFSLEYYINATVAPLCYFVLDTPIPVDADHKTRSESIQDAILADCNESFKALMGISSRAVILGESFETVFKDGRFAQLRDNIAAFCESTDTYHQASSQNGDCIFNSIYSVRRDEMIMGFWGSLSG